MTKHCGVEMQFAIRNEEVIARSEVIPIDQCVSRDEANGSRGCGVTKRFQPDAFEKWARHEMINVDRSVKGRSDLCSYQGDEIGIVKDVGEQPECAFGCVGIDPRSSAKPGFQ